MSRCRRCCSRPRRGSRSRPVACRRRRTAGAPPWCRSEEHTSELQSLMRISYAVFCLKKKIKKKNIKKIEHQENKNKRKRGKKHITIISDNKITTDTMTTIDKNSI